MYLHLFAFKPNFHFQTAKLKSHLGCMCPVIVKNQVSRWRVFNGFMNTLDHMSIYRKRNPFVSCLCKLSKVGKVKTFQTLFTPDWIDKNQYQV